ncbi:hypothetical protein B0H13DRAFT_2415482 [Mycena leptocephala]|nr:hypothetical protein B0H13DRAFT_2415482 [Mycena leptocephala]
MSMMDRACYALAQTSRSHGPFLARAQLRTLNDLRLPPPGAMVRLVPTRTSCKLARVTMLGRRYIPLLSVQPVSIARSQPRVAAAEGSAVTTPRWHLVPHRFRSSSHHQILLSFGPFFPIPIIPRCTLFIIGAPSSIGALYSYSAPGAAPRALPSLDADETKGRELRSELSRAAMHDDTKGWELRFELSRAPTHDETKAGRCDSCSPAPQRTTIQRPGAALRALPRLGAGDRRAGSCNPCSPVPRRYNGREMRLVLSRASTIQWPGDAPRALSCLDDTMAGRCASCSLAPRRHNGRELRLVLSRASTPTREGLGAANRALPCLDARRYQGREQRFVLSRASTHDDTKTGSCASSSPAPRRYQGREQRFVLSRALSMHDPDDYARICRRIPPSTLLLTPTFLAQIVNASSLT